MADKELIIKPKRAKGEDGYKVFSIRIREEIVSRIDEVSAQTNRSRNELIGTFLSYALDHCVVKTARKSKKSPGAFVRHAPGDPFCSFILCPA